jgi:hypothetical protein
VAGRSIIETHGFRGVEFPIQPRSSGEPLRKRLINEAQGQVKLMIASALGRYSNTVSAAERNLIKRRCWPTRF